jgi:hypothetical protein
MNEAMKAKDAQIGALQKDIAERINQSQQEKITNQKALEAARALFAADLETALATAAEERHRLEEEIRDYKERLGIFDEPPAVVESSTGLHLSPAEIRLGNEIRVLKDHYGIVDEKLDMDDLDTDSGDIDGLHLDSASDDKPKKKAASPLKKTLSGKNLARHTTSPGRRHKPTYDEESSLSSVSSEYEPHEESKSHGKKKSSPAKRRAATPSEQDDCTDNSTASAPHPVKAPESPNKAEDGMKRSNNVKTPAEMCKLFGITNTAVFDGGECLCR